MSILRQFRYRGDKFRKEGLKPMAQGRQYPAEWFEEEDLQALEPNYPAIQIEIARRRAACVHRIISGYCVRCGAKAEA